METARFPAATKYISSHCLKINTPPAPRGERGLLPLLNPFPPPRSPFSVCSTNKPSLYLSTGGILCNRSRESSNAIHCHDSAQGGGALFSRALKWPRSHLLRENLSNGRRPETTLRLVQIPGSFARLINVTLVNGKRGSSENTFLFFESSEMEEEGNLFVLLDF